jgi:hypothetical protein
VVIKEEAEAEEEERIYLLSRTLRTRLLNISAPAHPKNQKFG